MALDKVTNTGLSTLASGINASQTTLTVASGTGSRFPADTFNVVIWNSTDFANPIDAADREIVRCTSRSGDVLTITRGQEGTSGVAHNTAGKTYSVALILTARLRETLIDVIRYTVFTASGTYTKPANLIVARIKVVAGGGAGADATGTGPGGGGGASSYSESLLAASAIGATENITVGAAGGNSSFGTLVTANAGAAASGAVGGSGGAAGTGQIAIAGADGGSGGSPISVTAFSPGGYGGETPFGGRGRGGRAGSFAADCDGGAAKANSGSGGGGSGKGHDGNNTVGGAGAAGAAGIIIVEEFIGGT